jgi:hypothetical protein
MLTSEGKLNDIKREFYTIGRSRNTVDAIDGTHIKKTSSTYEHLFVDRKNFHSTIVQTVSDSRLKRLKIVAI